MKTLTLVFAALLALLAVVYVFTGFFVVQPLGAMPDGVTVWYVRFGLRLPFISSADGLLLDSGQGVSILGRAVLMAKIFNTIEKKIILRLPYSHALYLLSTGGKELPR